MGAEDLDWGHTGSARRQDKADRGSLGQRCSSAQIFYLCLSFFFFFFVGVRGKVGRETEKQNQREKKKKKPTMTLSTPLPALAPGLS